MEISEIKQNLSLTKVLENYSLQPDKNNMLRCPFHEDSTASLQVSFNQNKYKCHGCDKKGDVIQFVQDYEKLTKHEALKKCTAMIETIQSHWLSFVHISGACLRRVPTSIRKKNRSVCNAVN